MTHTELIKNSYNKLSILEKAIIRKNKYRRDLRLKLRIERCKPYLDAFLVYPEKKIVQDIIKIQRDVLWLRERKREIVNRLKAEL